MVVIINDRPAYRILSVYGFFGPDDHLYNEGECIYFDGEPNEEMEPLNELARGKMLSYLDKLDKLASEAAAKTGRPFKGRPRDLDGALTIARYDEEYKFRVRGTTKTDPGIESAEKVEVPEVGNLNSRKPRGRPKAELAIK